MNRREFLKTSLLAAAGAPLGAKAWEKAKPPFDPSEDWPRQDWLDGYRWNDFIHVKPSAQLVDAHTVALVWRTRDIATGWAFVSQDGGATWRRVWSQTDGICDINTTFHQAVFRDYDPTKPLQYRVASRPIADRSRWGNVRYSGETLPEGALAGYYIDQKAYKALVAQRKEKYQGEEFVEEGAVAAIDPGDFTVAMLNDIHHGIPRYPKLLDLAPEKLALIAFCGDICDHSRSTEDFDCFLAAPMSYASRRCHALTRFVRGNHETMGLYAGEVRRHCALQENALYGATTIGDTRLVFLDTGNVGADDEFAWTQNYYGMDEYIAREADWLKREVVSPEWKRAKRRIAFAHIPPNLYRDVSEGKGKDRKTVRRRAENRMNGLYEAFSDAGLTLLLAGHNHTPLFIPASAEYPYPMAIGGGPSDSKDKKGGLGSISTLTAANVTAKGVRVTQKTLEGELVFDVTV